MENKFFKNGGKKLKLILDSATFALLLSVILFSYEMINSTKESEQIVDNLREIQSSLSTRYLGLFPEYIDNINNLLDSAIEDQSKSEIRDSVIIFEDVLYYGIRSDAGGFRRMIENLMTLTNRGCHITIAYYDVNQRPFKQMIQDKLITPELKKEMRSDMDAYLARVKEFRSECEAIVPQIYTHEEIEAKQRALINKYFDDYIVKNPSRGDSLHKVINNIYRADLVFKNLTQQYYEKSFEVNKKKIKATIDGLREPLPQKQGAVDATTLRVNQLFTKLDEIKNSYMGKPYDEVTYDDFYNMYRDITLCICDLLSQQPNIELLLLKENILMCCWMSAVNGKTQAIFAFPSKYSSDEIGFISQDPAIARYIHTMLNGVRDSQFE